MVQAKNIFIVGIKGVAMTNLAIILKKMGKEVSGSDIGETFITDENLKKNKIKCFLGFNTGDIPRNTDMIIYSAAHGGVRNPQVQEGARRKIKILSQAEVLGELLKEFHTSLAVCGCHGKTTTSSLLAYSLIKLGQRPSYLVGSSSFNQYVGGDFQSIDFFVIEADEYGVNPPENRKPKFSFLNPTWIIGTNIDFDHPDVYRDINETKQAFFDFFRGKKLILNIDNPYLKEYYQKTKKRKLRTKILGFGFSSFGDYQIINVNVNKYSFFDIKDLRKNKLIGTFKISLYGQHNISNTAAVVIQLLELGFLPHQIKNAIKDFKGAKRRLELVYSDKDFILLDDYAHHPTEIEATIKAARLKFPHQKIFVIFQPHTFSRTEKLFNQFIKALSLSDLSVVLDIFPSAREKGAVFDINSRKISDEAKNRGIKNIIYMKKSKLVDFFKNLDKRNLVIITMGAGDVYKIGTLIKRLL